MIIFYAYRSKKASIKEFCISFKFNKDRYLLQTNIGMDDYDVCVKRYYQEYSSADVFMTKTECCIMYPPFE
jgi:hypothetical protein